MGTPPDQLGVTSLINDGLRQLRAGKVGAALKSWEEVLTLDEENVSAQSFISYIRKNRIRIAVELGRTPPVPDKPIEIPESWPAPPAGLCAPVPEPDVEPAEAPEPRRVAKSSGELPYAELELTGASRPRLSDKMADASKPDATPAVSAAAPKAPPAPRPPRLAAPGQVVAHPMASDSPSRENYLAMEIVLDDDETQSESLSLDGLEDSQEPSQPPSLTGELPEIPDDASSGSSAPDPSSSEGTDLTHAPRVATTFDEVSPSFAADPSDFAHRAPAGAGDSPYTTLVGLGPRVLFAEDIQGAPPPLDFAPPPGGDPPPDDPLAGDPPSVTTQDEPEPQPEPQAEALAAELESLMDPEHGLQRARQLHQDGEHDKSLQLTEELQERFPSLKGLPELLAANHSALEGSLLEQLGDLDSIPVPRTEDISFDIQGLDPRAAFLFSRIDGMLTVQDIIDISGMTTFESARTLLRLRELGLLDIDPPR